MTASEVDRIVGSNVAGLRRQRGWTQTYLADELTSHLGKAIDPTTITRAEKGRRPFLASELVALARILGTSVPRLLAEDDSPHVCPIVPSRELRATAFAMAELSDRMRELSFLADA